MLRFAVALATLLVVAPASARVLDPVKIAGTTPNADLKKGLALYDELDFDGALKSLDAALAAAPDLSKDETAAAALYAGMIAQSLNQKERANAYFEKALEALPDLELPGDAPPKVQAAFAEARKNSKPVVIAKDPLKLTPRPQDEATSLNESKPIYKQWWLWAGVGAVVVGTTVAIIVLTRSPAVACGVAGKSGCIDITTPAVWSSP